MLLLCSGCAAQAGVAAAAANPAALLLFSGGATRAAAGPLSEAVSYWSVANALAWFDAPSVRDRCALHHAMQHVLSYCCCVI
jgi:hypothetical protein